MKMQAPNNIQTCYIQVLFRAGLVCIFNTSEKPPALIFYISCELNWKVVSDMTAANVSWAQGGGFSLIRLDCSLHPTDAQFCLDLSEKIILIIPPNHQNKPESLKPRVHC